MIIKTIKKKAVTRFSMMVLAFSRNPPSQEKRVLSEFINAPNSIDDACYFLVE
tara:strand:+ start:979 stop:1137 length:159 start_codon:yes stop_codon:yes gene_type:complete